MSIHVSLSTTLRSCVPGYSPADGLLLELSKPLSAAELAQKIGLPLSEIKIVMLNGRRSELDSLVRDGDRIGYFPAVGGG